MQQEILWKYHIVYGVYADIHAGFGIMICTITAQYWYIKINMYAFVSQYANAGLFWLWNELAFFISVVIYIYPTIYYVTSAHITY